MKKKIAFLLSLLLSGNLLFAQDRLCVLTDRGSYVSGDLVFCSVFVFDEEGVLSPFSAVSYLELISTDGTAAESKIGLFNGRGCGSFRIPVNTPTGNYRLLAYTARGSISESAAPILSIYNTSSSARVKDGVHVMPSAQDNIPSFHSIAEESPVKISFPATLAPGEKAILTLSGPAADLCISVFHNDGLTHFPASDLSEWTRKSGKSRPVEASGEYEGEIITASVEDLGQRANAAENGVTAYLSTTGAPANAYVGRNVGNDAIQFYTGNIYGDHEIVCEVVSIYGHSAHISLKSPFRNPELQEAIPALSIWPAEQNALLARKASIYTDKGMTLDTLVQFLPKREDMLLSSITPIRYHLDDYNRFSSVRETCTEFVSELSYSRSGGKWTVKMVTRDPASGKRFQVDNILVMMDGVILTDHGILSDFDAMLLEDIDIYPRSIVIGEVPFNGVVNFITKKNYVTALKFPENTRVVDFKGVAYPVSYRGQAPVGEKDLRQVLLWLPAQALTEASPLEIPIQTPSYAGDFIIRIQGLLQDDGSPVSAEYRFSVE